MDKRHIKRQKIVQELYAWSFKNDQNKTELHDRTKEIIEHIDEFDSLITQFAHKYTIDKIAKTDVSILRLALFELLKTRKAPPKVIINEAVELAKEMGGDNSPGFINAVLGKVYEAKVKSEKKENKDE